MLRINTGIIYWGVVLGLTLMFICALESLAHGTEPKRSKFYDFGEQVIDGEIKKPTALYTESRNKVQFERLLKLKKSFMDDLMETAKDPSMR
tara:strand:- start:26163 stop:26438 length:276 start_codon:yes stop_codon:yes gene_type:complete